MIILGVDLIDVGQAGKNKTTVTKRECIFKFVCVYERENLKDVLGKEHYFVPVGL